MTLRLMSLDDRDKYWLLVILSEVERESKHDVKKTYLNSKECKIRQLIRSYVVQNLSR